MASQNPDFEFLPRVFRKEQSTFREQLLCKFFYPVQ